MTYQEFLNLKGKKEMNVIYNVTMEDGTTHDVEFIDKGEDYKPDGTRNHSLWSCTIDGNSDGLTLVTIDTIKARLLGKTARAKGNGTRKPKEPTKPLNDEELSDKINKHVDALQNAYVSFYNLLQSWGIDVNAINFANFDSSAYRDTISDICTAKNEDLKEDFDIAQQIAALQELQRKRKEQRENINK